MPNGHIADEEAVAAARGNETGRADLLSPGNEEGGSLANTLDLLAATHLAATGDLDEAERLLSRNAPSLASTATSDLGLVPFRRFF
jgi:hypothetical protein